jgi:uncharacterized membrane protein
MSMTQEPVTMTNHVKAYWTMLISSLISISASLVLSVDAIKLAKNPNSSLSCNINSVISCGKVAVSWQSNLLGFPNSFLGLICEPVVITLAVSALGGAKFPRWFMRSALSVYFAGLLFAGWLFSQSYFVIGAFCPWCLLVTTSTITVFSSMLRINVLDGNLKLSEKFSATLTKRMLAGWDTVVVTGIFSVLAIAIMAKYGNYILH